MPSEFGRLLMDTLTKGFLPRHPEIRLEIGMTDRPVDLIREGYDLALRAGRLVDSDRAVRTLGELPMALVASPEHLQRNGRPSSLEELSPAAHVRYVLGGRPFPISFMDGQTVSPEGRLDLDSGFALRGCWCNGRHSIWLLCGECKSQTRNGPQFGGAGFVFSPTGELLAQTSVARPVVTVDLDL
jgi:DNA-binding transcriptional LysR family regulator